MGIRAPTERGSEIPRGDLGVGECRRYARGRLRWYALHRHAARKGCLSTFRQPLAINVRASGAAWNTQVRADENLLRAKRDSGVLDRFAKLLRQVRKEVPREPKAKPIKAIEESAGA
jgi:hypothetical protein